MLFWALLASGQINMRKVDGWQTLATKPIDQPIDPLPDRVLSKCRRSRHTEFQHNSRRHPPRRSGRERTQLTTRWQLPPARRNLSGTAFMSGGISMTSIMEVSSTTNRS
jgi:hypothetical protein